MGCLRQQLVASCIILFDHGVIHTLRIYESTKGDFSSFTPLQITKSDHFVKTQQRNESLGEFTKIARKDTTTYLIQNLQSQRHSFNTLLGASIWGDFLIARMSRNPPWDTLYEI